MICLCKGTATGLHVVLIVVLVHDGVAILDLVLRPQRREYGESFTASNALPECTEQVVEVDGMRPHVVRTQSYVTIGIHLAIRT